MSGSRVLITGIGLVTPLGDDPHALHEALCAGRSGLRESPLADGLPCRLAGEIADFAPERYLGDGNIRPLDRTGRLVSAAAALALRDSGWDPDMRAREPVGLVVGTLFGGMRTISEFDRRALTAGPSYVKPLDFANTVINAAAGQAAIWHRLRGPNATLAGGPTAGLQALHYGVDLVRTGQARAVLAGGADELCSEALHAFARARLLSGTGGPGPTRPVPCDIRRDGFVLGEGAAFLMLEDEESALTRGARVLGEIAGGGVSCDAARGRDEAATAAALARAVAAARAGIPDETIDAVSLSARGSVALDRAEARGLALALGAAASGTAATAIKGALGESLGAAGALQVVTLLAAARTGRLPGVHALEVLEDGFPLPNIGPGPRDVTLRCGLATAIGWDGISAALLVRAL